MSNEAVDDVLLRPPSPLEGRRLLLGVSGGIAAYKAADLSSMLAQLGASVTVLMTSAATGFIAPETFTALTQNPVYDDVLQPWVGDFTGHVSLGLTADALIIAPATANTIAKLAHGLADDMVSATALVCTAPLIVAPAMEHNMFHHPATQANLQTLRDRGAVIVGPESGRLASGEWGDGRLAQLPLITGAVRQAIARLQGGLANKRVIITAGGTHEAMDPVRFIGNRSSGRMGYALAQAVIDAGGEVTLITGPTMLIPPVGANVIPVESAQDMYGAVHASLAGADAIIMTAAVADYRPKHVQAEKIKKTSSNLDLTMDLERNADIIASVRDEDLIRVGFAAETSNHVGNAQAKLESKNLDMVIVNDAVQTIGAPTSQATIVTRSAEPVVLPRMIKERLAIEIIDRLASLLAAG